MGQPDSRGGRWATRFVECRVNTPGQPTPPPTGDQALGLTGARPRSEAMASGYARQVLAVQPWISCRSHATYAVESRQVDRAEALAKSFRGEH